MERVEFDTDPEQLEEQPEVHLEDLEVAHEAALDVRGGFNPQPDPPGRQ